MIFTAWFAAPEIRINRVPVNDLVYHITASERLATAFERGEPFLDPWVSEWALGYPVWRSYQPIPHAVAALLIRMNGGSHDPAALFALFYYLLLVTFPVSVYVGSRLLGLPPPAAGLAALLSFASSPSGDFGGYGSTYAAFVWRGTGLYTQLFAEHFLVLSLGATARALASTKRKWAIAAGVLIALTSLSHIVFGYAAFVCSALLAIVGPRNQLRNRLGRWLAIALPPLLLLAWFVIPLALARGVVDHNRWEATWKWNSFGATRILSELLSGRLLDSGRLPLLTILLGAGAGAAIVFRRDLTSRRLLVLTAVWLLLFFGRDTWGPLLYLVGIPSDLPLHRFQAIFDICALLLGASGLTTLIQFAAGRKRALAVGVAAAAGLAILPIGFERAEYLRQNRVWGETNLAGFQANRSDLDQTFADLRKLLAERPGRVSAGMAATWGSRFLVGYTPVFAFLSRNHFDQVSFLYHAMSKTSEIMPLRDENDRGNDIALGIRAIVAPQGQPVGGNLRVRSVHGKFVLYESSREGYFGVVDLAGSWDRPADGEYAASAAWMKSPLLRWGMVVSLDPRLTPAPRFHNAEFLPAVPPQAATLRGSVIAEDKTGENYHARIQVNRPAYALIKITWNPDLSALVDGQPAPVFKVTPGFGAVPIPAGEHDVTVRYAPGILKPVLLELGLAGFVLVWFFIPVSIAAHSEVSQMPAVIPATITAGKARRADRRRSRRQ